jgi:hypothetical protein
VFSNESHSCAHCLTQLVGLKASFPEELPDFLWSLKANGKLISYIRLHELPLFNVANKLFENVAILVYCARPKYVQMYLVHVDGVRLCL